jgi:hypothetical protein
MHAGNDGCISAPFAQARNGGRGVKHFEFSKLIVILTILLVYPSVLLLSWKVLVLAEYAVSEKFTGALPYLTAIITPAWASFATVLGFYFNKSKAENKEKIRVSVKRDY